MKIRSRYRAFAVGILSLGCCLPPVQADSRIDSEQVADLVNRGTIVSVVTLQENFEQLQNVRWLDIELERESGHWVYEFEVINAQGIVLEYEFDAERGELLDVERKD